MSAISRAVKKSRRQARQLSKYATYEITATVIINGSTFVVGAFFKGQEVTK